VSMPAAHARGTCPPVRIQLAQVDSSRSLPSSAVNAKECSKGQRRGATSERTVDEPIGQNQGVKQSSADRLPTRRLLSNSR
jgi:hypothetical protein